MKNMFLGLIAALMIFFTLIIVMTVSEREIREYEAQEKLEAAIATVEQDMTNTGAYTIDDKKQFASDFTQALISKLKIKDATYTTGANKTQIKSDKTKDPNFKITIEENVNPELGLIQMIVHEVYTLPNGNLAEAYGSAIATVDQQKAKNNYTVDYYLNGVKFKTYNIEEGNALIVPVIKKNGKVQQITWTSKNGKKAVKGEKVVANISYYATNSSLNLKN